MDADEFINNAIELGRLRGIDALDQKQRVVWMISEAEVYCDKDGIDGLLHRYGANSMAAFAQAFLAVGAVDIARELASVLSSSGAARDAVLSKANLLITGRVGYSFESICAAIAIRP